MTIHFFDQSKEDAQQELIDSGFKPFRYQQICDWVYDKGVIDPHLMSNLPKELQDQLTVMSSQVLQKQVSIDGTTKLMLQLFDGELVEAVGIPMDDGKVTLCVSSQSGCAMGCVFCATGTLKQHRNLTSKEIIEQFLWMWSEMGQRPSRVVFMGMGEPLVNREGLEGAIKLFIENFGLSKRKITVSTVGLVDGIRWLATLERKVNLALSLHSALDDTRQLLVPTTRSSVKEIVEQAKAYRVISGRDVTIEVVLIAGLNDDVKHAHALADLVDQGMTVNLIPYNPSGAGQYKAPTKKNINQFKEVLEKRRVVFTERKARGQDIQAACGELAAKN